MSHKIERIVLKTLTEYKTTKPYSNQANVMITLRISLNEAFFISLFQTGAEVWVSEYPTNQ